MTTTDAAPTHPLTPANHRPIGHAEAALLAEEAYARFATEVERLTEDDWSLPTACEGWAVRDLVGHVVGAMRSAASPRELMSQMREIKRRARASGENETDVMTKVQIERTADLSTTALAAECRRLVSRAAAGRRRIPAPARRLVRIPVKMGTIDETWRLGHLTDVILTRDAWLHRIDLCGAVGRSPHLTAEHDGRIVGDVAVEWARRHGEPCRLVLTGPAGCVLEVPDAAGAVPDTVELDAVEFCRIVSGRAPGTGLLATEVPF